MEQPRLRSSTLPRLRHNSAGSYGDLGSPRRSPSIKPFVGDSPMKMIKSMILALLVTPAPALASELPECSNEAVIQHVFQSSNSPGIQLFAIPIRSVSLNTDNRSGRKSCRVTFRCDFERAREIEARIPVSGHAITQECFAINQSADANNPAWIDFTLEPDGKGGAKITQKDVSKEPL